jgi:hypothetical protein
VDLRKQANAASLGERPAETSFTFSCDLLYIRAMRPEISRAADDIQQAIALLRRHL